MHFDKPGGKSSTEGRKTYTHCQKRKKEMKFDDKFFPRNVLMVTLNAILLTTSAQVHWKDEVITVDVRWWLKSRFFLSSLIGDCSFGLWECSFLTRPTKNLQEGWEFFTQSRNSIKMCNFLGTVNFPLTWSSAYAEFKFDNLAADFGTNGR